MNRRTLRVVIAEDHALVRELLTQRLLAEPDVEVVAAVGSAEEALRVVTSEHPDLVLMDVEMPGLPTFDAARTILTNYPATRIVFVTAFDNDRYVEQALALPGTSYVTKTDPPETIVHAVRSTYAGRPYYSAAIRKRLTVGGNGVRLEGGERTRLSLVTPREKSVLVCVARGLSNKEIAGELSISVKTVEHHCEHLMTKLDLHDRVQLTRFAIREGLVAV